MAQLKSKIALVLILTILLGAYSATVSAQDVSLNINAGSDNAVWFISGEPSLVMNGFDLTPLNLTLPASISSVSLEVNTPVPGASIDLVIYEDANGGSPIDARLVTQTQVDIRQPGTFTYVFPQPVQINAPVVWIGFYLPVDFRFIADTSGSSVLTYWAWTPNGRVTLSDLSSAQILGPADGSAPVNIDMEGKARITAQIGTSTAASPDIVTTFDPNAPIRQIAGGTANLGVMNVYREPGCDTLFWDTEDIGISLRGRIALHCTRTWEGYAPPNPLGYERRQLLYDVYIFDDRGRVVSDWLDLKVTHCIKPNPADLEQAVVGLAYGSPRVWEIRPTVRYENLVCAEIGRGGYLSYFVPAQQ